MIVAQKSGTISKLKRTPWRFQRTFRTPLSELQKFVTAIFPVDFALGGASLTVEAVIFESRYVSGVVGSGAGTVFHFSADTAILADSSDEARVLLAAALADWMDFFFVPKLKSFVIYADHDEYCTFYANTRSHLNAVCKTLALAGFHEVVGYERT